jgi:hypothetical protein
MRWEKNVSHMKDWIYLVRDRDQWQILLYKIMNYGFRENPRNALIADELLALKKG